MAACAPLRNRQLLAHISVSSRCFRFSKKKTNLDVLGAQVALSSEEKLNITLGSIEDCGQVAGRHFRQIFDR
jgi:hypothetical protein